MCRFLVCIGPGLPHSRDKQGSSSNWGSNGEVANADGDGYGHGYNSHSILKQSFDSRLRLDTRRGQNNADGFGIGFYTDAKLGDAPCLFTSIIPAWNCTNLQRIASKTASRLIFAHVRATTEGSLSEDNCHPFHHGSLMWMHNGGIGGWKYIKRRLGERLADRWYLGVVGGTDSEWAFALFLDTLERMGYDPDHKPHDGGFGPGVLKKAMLKTIAIINELTDSIPESIIQRENVDTKSLLNIAVSDGDTIICTRYISSSTDQAASLYYSSGTQWDERESATPVKNYQMERNDKGGDIVLVASEPLTFERENWVNVPTNSILTIHHQTAIVHPIVDQYFDRNPNHVRSSAYVQTKGLATNERPPTRVVATPLPASFPEIESSNHRKALSPKIPFGIPRSRTPEATMVMRSRAAVSSYHDAIPAAISKSTAPAPRAASPQSPVQGNIKKKRRSLMMAEEIPGPDDPDLSATDTDEPPREYGNPNKIAQFFPELSHFTNRG